jgi:hypothetical protein
VQARLRPMKQRLHYSYPARFVFLIGALLAAVCILVLRAIYPLATTTPTTPEIQEP